MDINQLVTDVGSGAIAGAGDIVSGPVGDILFWVIWLTLVGFAVGVILKYLNK